MNDIFKHFQKWLNGHFALHKTGRKPKEQYKMYQMMVAVLLRDISGISLDKAFDALSRHDCLMPKVD